MGIETFPRISTFVRSENATPLTINDIQREGTFNFEKLQKLVLQLHPGVRATLQKNRAQSRGARSKGSLPCFDESDFVLMARDDSTAVVKLSLKWRVPRRVIEALND